MNLNSAIETNCLSNLCVILSLDRYYCLNETSNALWKWGTTNTKMIGNLSKGAWLIWLLLLVYCYQIKYFVHFMSPPCFWRSIYSGDSKVSDLSPTEIIFSAFPPGIIIKIDCTFYLSISAVSFLEISVTVLSRV